MSLIRFILQVKSGRVLGKELLIGEGGEVMEGGFQKSLQLFVANGYYVFEDNICVDLPNVLDGMPDYANAPLSRFVARSCIDRPEVLDGKPSYVNSPLPYFFAKARFPPILEPLGVAAVKEYG